MAQAADLVDALKRCLRENGITYARVAVELGLSESSVKRLFATRNLSLRRMDHICRLAGMEVSDLLRIIEEQSQRVDELSEDVEAEVVRNTRLMLVAYLLLNNWRPQDITAHYEFTEVECLHLLIRLDRLKLIELLPGNRVRLLVKRSFRWRADGPIERFIRAQVQQKFFDSSFSDTNECRLMLSGMLSPRSQSVLLDRAHALAEEFEEANREDRRLPLDERHGTSMVVAIRPWELDIFEQYRRKSFA